MGRIALVALVLGAYGSLVAPSVAKTNYLCLQKCTQHGHLYQDCKARCSDGTPDPVPPATPAAPSSHPADAPPSATVPSASQAPAAPSATRAPAAQAPAAPSASPARPIDYRCLYLCEDRGRTYQSCARACSH